MPQLLVTDKKMTEFPLLQWISTYFTRLENSELRC